MIDANVPNIEYVHSAWVQMQENHLVYPCMFEEQKYNALVDDMVSEEELNAALASDVCIDSTPKAFSDDALKIGIQPDQPWPRESRREAPRGGFGPSFKKHEQGVEAITITAFDVADAEESVMPEFDRGSFDRCLSAVRVVGVNPEPEADITDYQHAVMEDRDRLALGGCIPLVKWSELDNVIKYLDIFHELCSRKPNVRRFGRPGFSPEEIENQIAAETNSPIYKIMMHKLKRQLVVDGEINQMVANALWQAGYRVIYSKTLQTVGVMINPDNKLSWKLS